MTMIGLKISKTLLAVMLTSAVTTGSACAENATMDKARSGIESVGRKVDSSMNKVGNFVDDSIITAEVKATLVDHEGIRSTDISVKTDQRVVTLSRFVESQAQAKGAVEMAKGVEGMTSINDRLRIRDSKETSVKGYAGDTAITSEVRAELLADDTVPSRKMKIEATDDVVQLSGTIDSQAQSDRAESIVKAVDGVKNIKNGLKTQ